MVEKMMSAASAREVLAQEVSATSLALWLRQAPWAMESEIGSEKARQMVDCV